MKYPKVRHVVLLALMGALVGTSVVAVGQDGARGRSEAEAPRATGGEGAEENVDADAEVVEEGEERVKVYRFGGLDISGQLKSPQLLYFLNRLRAEFDRPKLPHRSFVPEMVRSTKGKAF